MIYIDNVDNSDHLKEIIEITYNELQVNKKHHSLND